MTEIKRITFRITDDNPSHVTFSLWVNGGLISAPGTLCLRVKEFNEFMEMLHAVPDDEAYKQGLI